MLKEKIEDMCLRRCLRGHEFYLRDTRPGRTITGPQYVRMCPECARYIHELLPDTNQARALKGSRWDKVKYLSWRWFKTENHGNTHYVGGYSRRGELTQFAIALTGCALAIVMLLTFMAYWR